MFLFKLTSNIYYLFRSIIKEIKTSRFLTLKYATYIDNRCVFLQITIINVKVMYMAI